MSDCDFFDDGDESLDQSDNLLTEAEFFGYQTPKGRQILLSIGSEKALTILITSPTTPLNEALDLTEELLMRFPNVDIEQFAQALIDKGLTFEILKQKSFLSNQLNVLIIFVERALDDRNLEAAIGALKLIHDSTSANPKLNTANDQQIADLLYISHRVLQGQKGVVVDQAKRGELGRKSSEREEGTLLSRDDPEEDNESEILMDLNRWILLLTDQIVSNKLSLSLLNSKKASYITELVVSFCISIENYESAWTFLIDYLSASTRIELPSPTIVNILYALEILSPRKISLNAFLNSADSLGPSGSIKSILEIIEANEPIPAKIKSLRERVVITDHDDPVASCVLQIVLKKLQTSHVDQVCSVIESQGTSYPQKQLGQEIGLSLCDYVKYLRTRVQIDGENLVRTDPVLSAEMRTIHRLRQKIDMITNLVAASEI